MPFIRLGLLAVLSLATRSLQAKDPINDFCRRWGHQTAQVDGKLFIDGGMVAWNPISTNPSNYTNTWLLYSDLNTSTQDVGMPYQYANLTKNATVPSVSGGMLWADEVNKCFYLFGGQYQSNPEADFSFWTYDVLLNQWNETKYSSNVNSLQRVAFGAGTTIEALGLGFYYGGWMNNLTTPGHNGPSVATSNLIQYDFTGGSLNNNTGPDSVGRAEGQMVYLPASDGGLLAYFGGIEDPYHNGTVVAANMSTIQLYDVASSKWYTQTASGDTPPTRRQFCAGATWADDHSSYNIYIYGGFGFGNVTGHDDAYILSIPSFKWIKAYPTNNNTIKYPKGSCSADVVNGDQMIVLGGWYTESATDCDSPKSQGQHNMNLGYNGPANALWDRYDPKISKYYVPTPIISAIGGGPTGGATVKAPGSWDRADLGVLLTRVPSFTARVATRPLPTSTGDSSPKSAKKTSVGAIAGGVVGGLVALILILGLVLFCLNRRKKALKTKSTTMEHKSPPPAELAAISPEAQELPTRGMTKYMSVAPSDPGNHPAAYSGRESTHSRAVSDDYRYVASPYPARQYPASPTHTAPSYVSPTQSDFPPEAYQQHYGQQHPPYSDTAPAAYDHVSYPSTALQQQYPHPIPLSQSPPHPPYAPVQPQVYYPPPPEPLTHSHTRSNSGGMSEYSGHTANSPPSTAPTPAQFYAQPVPRRSHPSLQPAGMYSLEGGSPSNTSFRGSVESRRRLGRGRFVEVDHM